MDTQTIASQTTSGSAIPPEIVQYQQVGSYAEIQEIMRSRDFLQGGLVERRHFLRDTLLMVDGDEHLERKNRLSPLFSKEAMSHYESKLLPPVIDEVMAELSTRRGADGLARSNFVPLTHIMLHRIAARMTGVDGVDTPTRTERFRQIIAKLGEAATAQFTTREKQDVADEGVEANRSIIDEFLRPSLDRRRDLVRKFNAGEIAKEDLPRDVLMMTCLNGDDARSTDTDYDAYVWRECVFFLIAATQTTTHTLPHVLVHLADWFKAHPEDAVKVDDSDFLHRAVGESLWLHQTAPVKFRIASMDVTLSAGRKIAKDEMVTLYAPTANYDEGLFGPNPGMFNPYPQVATGLQPWGLTFGAGAHMCLGRSLVTGTHNRTDERSGTEGTMVKILRVLYSYGVELDPDNPPKRTTVSYHDAYASVPIILRQL